MTATKQRAVLLEPDEDWITTEQAADILCVHARSLARISGQTIRRIKRNPHRKAANRTGYLWWRRDVEQVAYVRRVARLSLNQALRAMRLFRPKMETEH